MASKTQGTEPKVLGRNLGYLALTIKQHLEIG